MPKMYLLQASVPLSALSSNHPKLQIQTFKINLVPRPFHSPPHLVSLIIMCTMSSSRLATTILMNALQANQDDEVLAIDLLRAIREQASCLYETEHVRTMLSADPFGHFDDSIRPKIDQLAQSLQVVEVVRTNTLYGYSYIDATVRISVSNEPTCSKSAVGAKKIRSSPVSRPSTVNLYFKYEREAELSKHRNVFPGQDPPTLWYSIDVARDNGPRQCLMWVQVYADGNRPNNHQAAVNLEDGDGDEEDGWEDMSDGDDDDEQDMKRLRKSSHTTTATALKDQPSKKGSKIHSKEDNEDEDEEEEQQSDRFIAAMDPNALHQFLEWIDLDSINEDTAYFLLMTFPFFEHEWDVVGFVLDSVFGYDKDQHGDHNDDGEELIEEDN